MRSLTSFIRPLRGIPNSMSSPALTRYQPIPMTTPGGGVSGIHISNLSSSSTKSLLKNLDDAHAQVISFRCRLPERSRQLLDKGALQDLDADSKGRLIAPHFTKIMNNTSEGAERHETVVAFNVMHRCVCDRIQRPTAPKSAKIYLFQRYSEYGRSNNSGSLLCLTSSAQRITRGIAEEQDQLEAELLSMHKKDVSPCILFPTDDSIPVDDFILSRKQRLGTEVAANSPLGVVVLDGTGQQARNLERFLPPEIPRVRLPICEVDGRKSWLNPVRLQTEAHRICSAQAAAIVLYLVGEHEVASAVKHAVELVTDDSERDRRNMLPPLVPNSRGHHE